MRIHKTDEWTINCWALFGICVAVVVAVIVKLSL